MATLFLPLSRNVSCRHAHLHPKANICAKFHENWSKTEEVVRDARFATDRPPARQTDRRHADSYINTPLYTTCMRGYYYRTHQKVTKTLNKVINSSMQPKIVCAARYSEGSLIRRFVIRRFVNPNTQISYTRRFVNPKMK